MESGRLTLLVLLGLVAVAFAGTSVPSSGKQHHSSVASSKIAHNYAPAESERSGWGWSYPTGYSWSSGLSSVGLPLVLIPLIYFGFLWCVLLFGVAAFHHVPYHGGHSHGHGHHRYRRDVVDELTQEQVLSSI